MGYDVLEVLNCVESIGEFVFKGVMDDELEFMRMNNE